MGLAVIIAILAVNGAIIGFVLKSQSGKNGSKNEDQVTVNQSALEKLGVNRNSIGDAGIVLTVNPNAKFNGKVDISGDLSVAGQTKLNNQLSAPKANLAELQAGKTSLNELTVNGESTLSKLTLHNDLAVAGSTKLQGAVTISQLLTVNNSVNVSGNLGIGGVLSVGTVSARIINISGHVITTGSTPSVGPGPGLGSNGTVSISGNDAAGTVAVNIGAGSHGGIVAYIAFRSLYGATPHVVISPVNAGISNYYVTRTAGGFNIGISGTPSPGGYAFDYIVEQ